MLTQSKKLYPLLVLSSLSIACSTTEVIEEDNSPVVQAVVITSDIRNNGIKGQFGRDTERVSRIVGNMRRVDSSSSFSGSLLSRFGGKTDESEIIRLDNNIEYKLDNRGKRYQECEIGKCLVGLDLLRAQFSDETAVEYEEEEHCDIKFTRNDFSVEKTGQQRVVNGFEATEYKLAWDTVAQDDTGAESRNVIASTIWTTPVTGVVAEAVNRAKAFDTAYRAAQENQYPDQLHNALPAAAVEALFEYMIDFLPPEESSSLYNQMKAVTQITGYPVSRKFTWDFSGETCAAPEEPREQVAQEDSLDTGSIGGFIRSIGRKVAGQEVAKVKERKLEEARLQPFAAIIEEIKSIEILDQRESQFSVPSNYKLNNRG